ncbi:Mur ligase family protein, partial [Microcoleus sp. HI-ES]|nr:Mur ligase family protein [Microcoleus sp. HI-ES]
MLTVPLPAVSQGVLTALGTGIATDTRTLKGGEVFLALRGENFDGHQFVAKARDLGAIAAIVDRDWQKELPNFPLLHVDDTLKAYQSIARWWRDQFSIPIVAVTGSVGKTTVKELIAAVLSTTGNVLKTQYNYNNEIGVPKTLLELSPTHNYAVIEMGMRASGEIALLSQIASPTVAVITNVGTAHIGRLGSEEAIAQAKEILKTIARPLYLEGNKVLITASIGIALSTDKYQWPGDILRDADIAMYRAKALGKARYEVFTSAMHTQAVALMHLEHDLRESVEELNLKYSILDFGCVAVEENSPMSEIEP